MIFLWFQTIKDFALWISYGSRVLLAWKGQGFAATALALAVKVEEPPG